jgi:hypothetical protein
MRNRSRRHRTILRWHDLYGTAERGHRRCDRQSFGKGGTMRNWRARAKCGAGLLFVFLAAGTTLTTGAPSAGASGGGTLQGNGSVDEAWLTGANPGDSITLLRDGTPVTHADRSEPDPRTPLLVGGHDLGRPDGHLLGPRPRGQPSDRLLAL